MCLASSGSEACCWKDSNTGLWTVCALAAKETNPSLPFSLPMQTGPKEPAPCVEPGMGSEERLAWPAMKPLLQDIGQMQGGWREKQWKGWRDSSKGFHPAVGLRSACGWVDAMQKSPFVCGASEMGEWEGAVLKGRFPAVGLSTTHLAGCRDRAALPTVTLRARDGCRLAGRCDSRHCQVCEMPIR